MIKNKNKSKQVQKFVQSVQKAAIQPNAAVNKEKEEKKKKKLEEEARQRELDKLFKVVPKKDEKKEETPEPAPTVPTGFKRIGDVPVGFQRHEPARTMDPLESPKSPTRPDSVPRAETALPVLPVSLASRPGAPNPMMTSSGGNHSLSRTASATTFPKPKGYVGSNDKVTSKGSKATFNKVGKTLKLFGKEKEKKQATLSSQPDPDSNDISGESIEGETKPTFTATRVQFRSLSRDLAPIYARRSRVRETIVSTDDEKDNEEQEKKIKALVWNAELGIPISLS